MNADKTDAKISGVYPALEILLGFALWELRFQENKF
jgi:hypothetical protein